MTGNRHLVTVVALTVPRSRVAAELAQYDAAAAMTEPTAALSGSSRVSRLQTTLFQRLLGCFPHVIAAAFLPIATLN